jgi:hypothetical protein
MTVSKTYKAADPFKRKLLREIAAGKHMIKRGWDRMLPADIHTLESVVKWYDKYQKKKEDHQ